MIMRTGEAGTDDLLETVLEVESKTEKRPGLRLFDQGYSAGSIDPDSGVDGPGCQNIPLRSLPGVTPLPGGGDPGADPDPVSAPDDGLGLFDLPMEDDLEEARDRDVRIRSR